MAAAADRLLGGTFFAAGLFISFYYTVWTLIMPFIGDDHPLQTYFPSRYWAILIPTVLGVLFITILAAFVGLVLMRSAAKKAAKAKAAGKKDN
eukprot:PLAT2567.2.p2 GENE.PLAT2567.2~~PLAT2567.2.p2  ORF type:complete len:109 (-),score=31.00 PLAT2567.2:119-397(-)